MRANPSAAGAEFRKNDSGTGRWLRGWAAAAIWTWTALGPGGGLFAEASEPALRSAEVVISATLTEMEIADAPGSVEVVTAREIADMNARTAAEALETAVGLVVSRESGRVQVPSIRGARSKHTLVLLDGRRLAFGFNDLIDLRQIPTVMIERIEIVRGPASALYGSDALGGVVNIITKAPPDEWSGMVSGQFGIDRDGEADEYIGGASAGGALDRFRFLLSAELRRKDGWDADDTLPDDGYKEKPGFVAGRFAFDATGNQTLAGGFEYMDNTYTGGQFYENMARERRADEDRHGYFLQYDLRFSQLHRLMLRANRSAYRHELGFDPFAASGERRIEQDANQFEARYSGFFLDRHLMTLAGEFRRDALDNLEMDVGTKENVENYSLFLQDEFNISDPLYAVAALRYDHHSEFGSRWSPKASLVYEIGRGLRLKGSVGKGFRAPSLTELFVTSFRRRGREIYAANPDLEPETSTSYELGVQGERAAFHWSATLFRNEVKNLIEAVFERAEGSGPDRRQFFRFRNIAESTQQGVETEGGVRLPMGFSLDGNAVWLDVDNKSGGEDIGAQPEYKAYFKLGYERPEWRMRANLRMSYLGRMTYADGDRYSCALFGARVAKVFGEDFEAFAGVDNIFDKRVERDGVVRIEPTTFYAGVSVGF
jgi:outer membrane receptor for ferrienterochelin and colicins